MKELQPASRLVKALACAARGRSRSCTHAEAKWAADNWIEPDLKAYAQVYTNLINTRICGALILT